EVAVEDAAWEHLNALQRRQHILDAAKSLLLRESQVQPLILVFENLHWIDSETQAFLDRLVESLPTARLLLLVNYRPEYQHSWGSKTYYVQLRLDPLLPENAMELLRDLLGEDGSLGALKQRLIEWTEGNPFFLEETRPDPGRDTRSGWRAGGLSPGNIAWDYSGASDRPGSAGSSDRPAPTCGEGP